MVDIIMTVLLVAGLIYSYFVIHRWHKLAKKYDVLADELHNDITANDNCIKSSSIFSPQNYLEAVTNECFIIHSSKPVIEQIEEILNDYGFPSISYDLTDVRTAMSAGVPIVLVDCCDVDENLQPIKSYRWFQVPNSDILMEGERIDA